MNSNDEKSSLLPNGSKVTVDDLVSLYKKEHRIPVPVAVEIDSIDQVPKSCRVTWSQNNFERVENVKIVTSALINYDKKSNQISSIEELPGFNANNVLSSVTSESGKIKICINKSTKESKDANAANQNIEIWDLNENSLLNSIDVDSTKHGLIALSPFFSSLSFSSDETKVIYVAEKKIKTESYFKDTNLFKDDKKEQDKKGDLKNETAESKSKGDEYLYRQSWGEQLEEYSHTCVCILTIKPEYKLKIIDLPDLSLGKPFWIDNETIGFNAYQESPKRLGLIHCSTRIAYLYKCKLAQKDDEKDDLQVIRGQNDDVYIHSPQINQQRDKVIFFENPSFGPHWQASQVNLWDLKTNEITTVFNKIEENKPLRSLFIIPKSYDYWSKDGQHIVLNSCHNSNRIVVILNVITKELKLVDQGLELAEILDFKNDLLAISVSSPNSVPVVKLGIVNGTKPIEFKQLRSNHSTKNDKISYKLIVQNEDKLLDQIQTIVIGPTDTFDKPTASIIIIHGGPHSVSTLAYSRRVSFFVSLGFKVCLINYRGSLHLDDDYVKQLCGNIGDYDVKDCISAINHLISLNLIDKDNISLFGGSHGGFLVAQLIGQYPEFNFRSCIPLNPAIDLSKMIVLTDIPEWTLYEGLGFDIEMYKKINDWPEETDINKQMRKLLDIGIPKILDPLFKKSPMSHIEKVRTPVLMVLGSIDKRVPHYQGLTYVNALKTRGVETKTYIYPDNHNIGKIATSADLDLNVVLWLLDHLKN